MAAIEKILGNAIVETQPRMMELAAAGHTLDDRIVYRPDQAYGVVIDNGILNGNHCQAVAFCAALGVVANERLVAAYRAVAALGMGFMCGSFVEPQRTEALNEATATVSTTSFMGDWMMKSMCKHMPAGVALVYGYFVYRDDCPDKAAKDGGVTKADCDDAVAHSLAPVSWRNEDPSKINACMLYDKHGLHWVGVSPRSGSMAFTQETLLDHLYAELRTILVRYQRTFAGPGRAAVEQLWSAVERCTDIDFAAVRGHMSLPGNSHLLPVTRAKATSPTLLAARGAGASSSVVSAAGAGAGGLRTPSSASSPA